MRHDAWDKVARKRMGLTWCYRGGRDCSHFEVE
jgi:hypothetical protein